MADKKSGYEKAAEAQQTSGSAVTQTEPLTLKKKRTVKVRKVDADLRAMNSIMAILEKFSCTEARRILRYCGEKIDQESCRQEGPSKADPRRLPGGDLYTAPLPGLGEDFARDRDHG